jgi:hypothetical protein
MKSQHAGPVFERWPSLLVRSAQCGLSGVAWGLVVGCTSLAGLAQYNHVVLQDFAMVLMRDRDDKMERLVNDALADDGCARLKFFGFLMCCGEAPLASTLTVTV